MFNSSRGILYTAPPAAEDEEREPTAAERDESATPETDGIESPADDAVEAAAAVEDASPTATRADWTGNLPADD